MSHRLFYALLEVDLYQTVREQPQAALNNCDFYWKTYKELHIGALRSWGTFHGSSTEVSKNWAMGKKTLRSLLWINDFTERNIDYSQKWPDKLLEKAKDGVKAHS
jgi:hypothetical protein